jgi:short-subunit dehydrogenase
MSLGTAVIVGVGPGLRLALARTFAAADHPVALLARDATRLDCYLAELNRAERPARAYTATPRTPRSCVAPSRRRSTTLVHPTS